jgi:putative Holliday junction resolvase
MPEEYGRILGVDPGEKRTGVALSDPTGTIASALGIIVHQSRAEAAAQILRLAEENQAVVIVVGHPLDADGEENPQSRKSDKLALEIEGAGSIPVILWDEYGSTQQARQTRRDLNVTRQKRSGHLDQVAAVIILQDYLDSQLDKEDY